MKNLFKILMLLFINLQLFANDSLLNAIRIIKKHEGFSKYLYIDTNGYSIGYGTNLVNGVDKYEAEFLLRYRLLKISYKLKKYNWYKSLSSNRKVVLLDMAYNLGVPKLLTFKKFIYYLKVKNYNKAAMEMKNSLWYKQTGKRARYLVKIMRTNKL